MDVNLVSHSWQVTIDITKDSYMAVGNGFVVTNRLVEVFFNGAESDRKHGNGMDMNPCPCALCYNQKKGIFKEES